MLRSLRRTIMAQRPLPKYISAEDLKDLLYEEKRRFLVVDVRDDDYVGGHIVGSRHIPSVDFPDRVDALVKETNGFPLVIFHCALSQSRGPKAARIYNEALAAAAQKGDTREQDVYILRGGFTQFQATYKDDPKLIQDWDREYWESEGYH